MGDLSKMKNILAPSILSADFKVLGEQVKTCAENGAEYLHFDVMECLYQTFHLESRYLLQSKVQQIS